MSSEIEHLETATLPFIQTKEHLRFAEFCDTCLRYRYIGLCYGPPGIGKTWSARSYSRWDLIEAQFHEHFYSFPRLPNAEVIIANSFRSDVTTRPPELRLCRSVFYTPTVASTPRRIEEEVRALRMALSYLVDDAERVQEGKERSDRAWSGLVRDRTALLIVDEVDRLKTAALEQIRDIYDRSATMGVVLLGCLAWINGYRAIRSFPHESVLWINSASSAPRRSSLSLLRSGGSGDCPFTQKTGKMRRPS